MLTREHGIAEFDFRSGEYKPDRLTRGRHVNYLQHARRMLRVYQQGIGETRRELHREIQRVMSQEDECPLRRIDAFCKLLDDASDFNRDSRGKAAKLREQVFRLAAEFHPLVNHPDRLFEYEEQTVKKRIAGEVGMAWPAIEEALYADIIEFHRLRRFDGYPRPEDLLARYNVAQIQVALYQATSMTVWMDEDFKTILRYAKLARLMHRIAEVSPGRYCLHLDGPASVLRQTRRYGVGLATFLPALISCRNWRMKADLTTRRGWKFQLTLSSRDGLQSHLPPPTDFDSKLEEDFATKWGDEIHDGWAMTREGAIFQEDQHVFVPDFLFRHESGVEVALEIVGFWTPEYLAAKAQTLLRFQKKHIMLAVVHSSQDSIGELPADTIVYKTVLKVKDVLASLATRL
jgi:predicted nuclease of restriction endonuclease-like RecB superfamily